MLCVTLLITSCGHVPEMTTVGKPAPDFSLVDLTGRTWTLSELKGQVVFVNFWATWCPPCREEMPAMQRLYKTLPPEGFKMLAILSKDAPAQGASFARKLNITFPILDDQNNQIGPKYGLTGVPETFIIDQHGILREKFIGPAQWDSPQFIQKMLTLINQE